MESASIRVGSTYASHGGITYKSSQFSIHPKYRNMDYDVAVIKLNTPILITKASKLVTLPTEKCTVPAGTNLTVAGWGRNVSVIIITIFI